MSENTDAYARIREHFVETVEDSKARYGYTYKSALLAFYDEWKEKYNKKKSRPN